jgi:ABC-2 type transport system permease protein
MHRDPSSIAIGVLLPVMLVLLFGYEFVSGLTGSPYFRPTIVTTLPEGLTRLRRREADALIHLPSDYARQLARNQARVGLILDGQDTNYARLVQNYALSALSLWSERHLAERNGSHTSGVRIESRVWFNEANDSHYYLVPGLIVLVMTLIGAFLTALVMAREWERGTLESLFVTPVRAGEILIGKTIPYFVLGLVGLTLCLLAAKFLFHVPFRGSLLLLMGVSMVYLLVCLGAGLLISAAVKNQFLASQIAVLTTFLPAVMLSGFLFDLRSVPVFLQLLTWLLPPRYYVDLLQTLFLAGNIPSLILLETSILALMALFFLGQARRLTRKRLE